MDSYQSRLDDTKAEPNRSRTVSKGFGLWPNGKEYRGYVIYKSDESWPSLMRAKRASERISYLGLYFPGVNKPAVLCEFQRDGRGGDYLHHILPPSVPLLSLLLVIRTSRRGKKKKTGGEETRRPSNNRSKE